MPALKGNYGAISEYNALTSRFFNSSAFPDRVYFTNGLWFTSKYDVITEKEVPAIAFHENVKVVYKVDNSSQGKGVYILDANDFNTKKLMAKGNGVLQKYVNQHSFFQKITPNSVATLRITSIIDSEGNVAISDSYLRVGRDSDSYLKADSLLRISVDKSTGILDKYGYLVNWRQTTKHPDTGFVFEGKQIPDFKKFTETAIQLHKMVPFTRTIGWDMILDEKNNVQVMEWNGSHNDIKFSEATQGPCFANLGWEELWKK